MRRRGGGGGGRGATTETFIGQGKGESGRVTSLAGDAAPLDVDSVLKREKLDPVLLISKNIWAKGSCWQEREKGGRCALHYGFRKIDKISGEGF